MAGVGVETGSAETTYFYQDLDEAGNRLNGDNGYTITFPAGRSRRCAGSGH